jgi:hypothetical protein
MVWQPEEEALVEQILSQPDPIEFDTTTDGCSTSSYVSTVSYLFFVFALHMLHIAPCYQ